MCGQMGHLTRLCKQQTACKVIAKDHTEEKVIAQHDFSEETWREFKKSQCATKNCTPSRPRSARPEIIRSHGEDFSAEISSSFIIRSSFGAHEANPNGKDHTEEKVIGKDHTVEKVITEVECETEGFRDHKAPAVIENDIVKVECEAGSARDHNAPEAKVKVREPEAKESNLVKIHESVANDNMIVKVRRPEANANEKKMEYSLQNRQYSDKVKRESPETTTIEESNCNERIDIGRTDTEGSPVREKALEIGKMDVPSIEHRGDNQMKDDNIIFKNGRNEDKALATAASVLYPSESWDGAILYENSILTLHAASPLFVTFGAAGVLAILCGHHHPELETILFMYDSRGRECKPRYSICVTQTPSFPTVINQASAIRKITMTASQAGKQEVRKKQRSAATDASTRRKGSVTQQKKGK
ncbi:hypothetical protein PRIPAC_79360 [Pristionchus pacificus]|uniref:Uncharacterized protein n=1 Tax=Pristionchus pacificus TaxID=54126 RepID=A0A2A6CQE7_PRIPA|nr:hypothetical protein PRIPAC_79360 [Pristionchus pacificus]|eukprot:PDM80308.1 hypothetical protein PRIPAC_32887 [Pristionchus pacificus]